MNAINFRKSLICLALLIGTINYRSQAQANPEVNVDQILINNIGSPWALTFISNDEILFTERSGNIRRHNMLTNTTTNITGGPTVAQVGQGGLLDVVLHPNFRNNNLVYLSYSVAVTGGQTLAIGRGTLVGNTLQNFTQIFSALPIVNSGQHFGSRIAFDRNNFLYFSVGDRGTPSFAQDRNNHAGKVMRLNDDGTVPNDNPFVGVPNTRPEIFSFGHRNIQGMAMNPANGLIYAHEHGPRGGDELNLIKRGANYGWPLVTFGIDYNGTIISEDTARPGLEPPLTYWVPSIAPSGMVFVQNNQAPNEADILIGALAGTHLHWLKMRNDRMVQASRNARDYARFRDVRQAPDGRLYALTESPNRLVRLRTNITLPPITGSCRTPNLGNDFSICGTSGNIILNSGLTAANRTFSWERNRVPVTGNQPTLTINSSGTYTVFVDSSGCRRQEDIIVSNVLPTPSLGIDADLCNPTTLTLDAGVTGNGISFQWTRNNVIVGSNSKTIDVSQPGTYIVTLNASNCANTSDTINITTSLPTVMGDTLCQPGIANLSATGTGPFNWYDQPNGGSILATLPNYNPSITSTSTFYVQATPGINYTYGPSNRGTNPWNLNTVDYPTDDKELVIVAHADVTLEKLDVDPLSTSQNVTINITDLSNNTIIRTVIQAITGSMSTINIGASLVAGRSYRIDAIGTTGQLIFRNQGNVLWPQTIANVATIRANDEITWANSWSLFYNIVISTGKACNRIPVVAAITTCQPLSIESATNQEETDLEFGIYPNPFENSFKINFDGAKKEINRIDILKTDGQLVQSFSENLPVEIGQGLANGTYFVKIVKQNKVYVKQIIKIK